MTPGLVFTFYPDGNAIKKFYYCKIDIARYLRLLCYGQELVLKDILSTSLVFILSD